VYGKLASDLVPAITLRENGPVKSAVIESPKPCRAGQPLFEFARVLVRLAQIVCHSVNANNSVM
jgi:hypothetical protein